MRGGEIDSTIDKDEIRFWKSMWNQKYFCGHIEKMKCTTVCSLVPWYVTGAGQAHRLSVRPWCWGKRSHSINGQPAVILSEEREWWEWIQPSLGALWSWGQCVSWRPGLAWGLCPADSRALTVATHWSGPDLEDPLESPGLQSLETSQQLDYTATDIKVRASTSLSLSVQVSKNGPGKVSCLSLGGGRRST